MRVIYIDVDSLRPDHTEPYGYRRKITPNLQEFARDAVVFDRYYCSDSPCMPSRAALSSGQFGITNGVIGHFGRASRFRFPDENVHPKDRPLLGGHLHRHGVYTASISCFAERHLAYWFLGNFRESLKPTLSMGNDEDAADVNEAAISWIRRHAHEDNWFLHVNYWDPHTDYVEPREWVERAGEAGPPPGWPDEDAIASHREVYGARSALDLHGVTGERSPTPDTMPDAIESRADFVKLVDGYDGEILYWDHHFGRFLGTLDDLGMLEDTAIIVSADHGESMGENGSYAEHQLATEPTHRVPLIFRWPGLTENLEDDRRRCDALLYNLDLGPTLCELLDVPVPEGWHGESFAAAVRGRRMEGRSHLILSHGAHSYQRAVRTRDHLYVRTLHPGCFRAEWEQLYNVTEDPYLTRNVLTESSGAADQAKALLSDWWYQHAGVPGAFPDPMQTTLDVGPTFQFEPAAYIEHLRDTGRKDFAADLQVRLGRSRSSVYRG
jgi:arylsulfatase A-like enzyme